MKLETKEEAEAKEAKERRQIMTLVVLHGMLASAPTCDRTKVDKRKWVKIATEWVDEIDKVK